MDTEKKEDTTIVKDISNVPIFKSFQYKCSAYTSRIYLYDEVKTYCGVFYICDQIYVYFDERENSLIGKISERLIFSLEADFKNFSWF